MTFITSRMLFPVLLLQLSGPPILTVFSNRCTGSRYRNALNTKSSPPHTSSSGLLVHVTCVTLSQSNLLDHPHWSLFSNHQLTPVSRSQTTPSSMPHLTCVTNFLLLFMFLISSVLHHHPALLHHHTLIMDHLLTFLVTFYTLVLKRSLFGSHWRRCSYT